ncbi:uncharacterized protein LOC132186673 [Corylus avellana]|uniref:uncharacterized protein LOC132186673 n=1 Tax=Corylus avellana TaxID=13451 RepID=UPI001E22F53F|nr:uncharacterized protein LOC132186673 [Corylus avellana]
MAATKVSLKLLIDKKSQRVLFAEADKEFVDFLFSIFTLPVGVVTRLLKDGGGMVGCLPSLYRSIENLSTTYIRPDKDKCFVLEPKVIMPGAKVPLLLPNLGSTFRQLYSCPNYASKYYVTLDCARSTYVAYDQKTVCPKCDHFTERMVTLLDPPRAIKASSASEEGYVIGTVKYMVMDDMEVKALCATSLVTLLSQFDVKDIEEKVVDFGMDEGVKLLQASLHSHTAFTDVFLPTEIIKIDDSIKNDG